MSGNLPTGWLAHETAAGWFLFSNRARVFGPFASLAAAEAWAHHA